MFKLPSRPAAKKWGLPEGVAMKQQTTAFSLATERALRAYTVAATAAGVGALCFAYPAEAKIVYTPANVNIEPNAGLINFDINHDGIADFGLSNLQQYSTSLRSSFAHLKEVAQRQNAINVSSRLGCASGSPKGARVGFKERFGGGTRYIASATFYGGFCRFAQPYLGLKFVIKGKVHFGWMQLSGGSVGRGKDSISASVTGYAYETIPGKAIIAGATKGPDDPEPTASVNPLTPVPATLGALAMGAPGLSILRRKESALQGN
jgi:hypothetical protein